MSDPNRFEYEVEYIDPGAWSAELLANSGPESEYYRKCEELLKNYQSTYMASGIWDMTEPRKSVVVPSGPLTITGYDEVSLNRLARSIYGVFEDLVDAANDGRQESYFQTIRNKAGNFAGPLRLPPAIRADVVQTDEGFKVVEVDPSTAISLGETSFLSDLGRWGGGLFLESRLAAVVADRVNQVGASVLKILVPESKTAYLPELGYFAESLRVQGTDTQVVSPNYEVKLQDEYIRDASVAYLWAAQEDTSLSRFTAKQSETDLPTNDQLIWQNLSGLSDKRWMAYLASGEMPAIEYACRQQYLQALREFIPPTALQPDDVEVVAGGAKYVLMKPRNSTGSNGIFVAEKDEAAKILSESDQFICQRLLTPRTEYFGGACLSADGKVFAPTNGWRSRISIYCGERGLEGAQVTARPADGVFTNVHGQSDALQTYVSIDPEWEIKGKRL